MRPKGKWLWVGALPFLLQLLQVGSAYARPSSLILGRDKNEVNKQQKSGHLRLLAQDTRFRIHGWDRSARSQCHSGVSSSLSLVLGAPYSMRPECRVLLLRLLRCPVFAICSPCLSCWTTRGGGFDYTLLHSPHDLYLTAVR